eukprot:NODE_18_length_47517_cov_0.674814.p15 type:complete len:293 gc:universal NODE_18_length_47517_cov_0.674814:7260-6382(-)
MYVSYDLGNKEADVKQDAQKFFNAHDITNLGQLKKFLKTSSKALENKVLHNKSSDEISVNKISHVEPTNEIKSKWNPFEDGKLIYKKEYYILKDLTLRNVWVKVEEVEGQRKLVIKFVEAGLSNEVNSKEIDMQIPIDLDSLSVYAKFLTKRKVFVPVYENSKATINWDHVTFTNGDEYSVFTVVGDLDFKSTPKRSKVVECLYRQDNDFYNKLVNVDVIRDIKYSTKNMFMPGKHPNQDEWVSSLDTKRLILGEPTWKEADFELLSNTLKVCKENFQSMKVENKLEGRSLE